MSINRYCNLCKVRSDGVNYRSDSDEDDEKIIKDAKQRARRVSLKVNQLEIEKASLEQERKSILQEKESADIIKNQLGTDKAELTRLYEAEVKEHAETKEQNATFQQALRNQKEEIDRLQKIEKEKVELDKKYEAKRKEQQRYTCGS